LQAKSLAGQEKGEERIGNTVEPFDKPGGDFRCNPKGRGPFDRWRRCSSLMIYRSHRFSRLASGRNAQRRGRANNEL
jgi:hypothetical protein